MKVLVSGAGIAGPCLAYWLDRHGIEATIVERAPRLREGGYVVDFWGAGFDVAERMGIVPELLEKGYQITEVREVDRNGERSSGFEAKAFERMTAGRFTSVPRSELAAAIHRSLGDRVETLFGDSVTHVEDAGDDVRVRFESAPARTFDLVVGADGLHSNVREHVFGAEDRFEHFLGLKVAAFTATGYRPRNELMYVVHTEVGQQIGRFSMRDDRTMFLFIFADPRPDLPTDLAAQKSLLHDRFSASGWESASILAALDTTDVLYMDRVSQIRMDHWTKGRVALVGDAAFCVSLLGGQGSALAMVAAYVLAGEIAEARGDHATAFRRYEERLGTFLRRKQKAAVKMAPFFAPRSKLGLFVRNQSMKLMAIPFVTELGIGRELRDVIALPSYGC